MADPLRHLLILAEHYPPMTGGIATSAQRIARSLHRIGAAVHVVTFDNSRHLESEDYLIREEDRGVEVSRVGPFFVKRGEAAAHLSEKYRAILRRRAFDQITNIGRTVNACAVFSLSVFNAGFLGGLAANALRIPHLAGVRGNDVGRDIFHTKHFSVIAWTLQNARRVICVNRHLRERLLVAFPQLAGRSCIVPNGVPVAASVDSVDAFNRIQQATGWPEEAFIVVFIGTPREKKGIVQFLQAIALLPAESNIRILVIGPEIGDLERRIVGDLWEEFVASGRLHATGWIPRHDVARWAAGGHAVVMPSLDDGMANGLLEGMALGLCAIASAVFEDVVRDGETGILLDRVTPATISAALERAAQDRHRTRSMGSAGREYVLKHHSPEAEAAAYVSLLGVILRDEAE